MDQLQFLALHELLHAVVAGGLAYFIGRRYRSRSAAMICFCVSFFSDADHLLDYLLFTEFNRFDVLEFLRSPQYRASGLPLLLFHAYEWVAGLSIIAWFSPRWRRPAFAAALGLFAQIFIDQLSYSLHPLHYFFIFRAMHGFH